MARVLTPLQRVPIRARRSAGLALAGAAGLLLALALAWRGRGAAQMAGAALATGLVLLCCAQALRALHAARQARREAWLFSGLALNLPDSWYLLAELSLPSHEGERLPVWAVAVGPGGLAVIHLCSEPGEFFPAGPVWLVQHGRSARVIPSPAQHCARAAALLREMLSLPPQVPVWPLVVLTDRSGIYHPAATSALVIGAPHLPGAVLQCGRRPVLQPRETLRLAADLARYHQPATL